MPIVVATFIHDFPNFLNALLNLSTSSWLHLPLPSALSHLLILVVSAIYLLALSLAFLVALISRFFNGATLIIDSASAQRNTIGESVSDD